MRQNIIKIALINVLIILQACTNQKSARSQENDTLEKSTEDRIFVSKAQFENSEMVIEGIQEMAFPVSIQTTGMIDVPPENRAVVNASLGGYIKTTPLLIGDQVRKGQPLVTIENPEFISLQQEYLEIKEQLTFLKAEYERQKTMEAEKITSQKNFLQAESNFKRAKAQYNGLRKQLEMINISPAEVEAGNINSIATIYAPISGSITRVNVTKGAYVSPATAILEIVNNDHIHLELNVFEKDIMRLEKEQPIRFKIPESSSETYMASVHLIGRSLEDNRTVKVHGHLEDHTEATFIPGMFVDAVIVTDSAFAKAVPETAVIESEQTNYVLKLSEESSDGYYFEKIAVAVGAIYNNYMPLTESDSITKQDLILTKGAFSLIGQE